jgi:hypothetical protein
MTPHKSVYEQLYGTWKKLYCYSLTLCHLVVVVVAVAEKVLVLTVVRVSITNV